MLDNISRYHTNMYQIFDNNNTSFKKILIILNLVFCKLISATYQQKKFRSVTFSSVSSKSRRTLQDSFG